MARVVCWQSREEWLYVYRALYSFDDPEAQRKGLDRVAAWRSRSAGKLPLAIECTANLISAHLAFENIGCDVQRRLTLAMAIVRFVNGMADQVQKGKFARSVQSIAEDIGLPDWLVDLRHAATHASLPSMETLQCGLHVSLSWLQGEYWEAQINQHQENEEKLLQLLNDYQHMALLSAANRKSKKVKTKKLKECSEEIVSILSMGNLWSLLPHTLSHKGMLIPSRQQLHTLDINWPLENTASDSSISDVPKEIISMWKPLLETLDNSSSEFTAPLMIHFMEKLSDVHDNPAEDVFPCYAAWIKHLLESGSHSNKKSSVVLTNDIPWVNLLQVALENPTVYLLTLIPLILENIPALSTKLKENIQHLVSVFLNSECSHSNSVDESQQFDLEELIVNRSPSAVHPSSPQQEDSNSPASRGWQASQGATQWHLIPFGEILGASQISPTNLELSQHFGDPFHRDSSCTEHFSGTENDENIGDDVINNDEAILSDNDNLDDLTTDQNSDQSCHNIQGNDPVEIVRGRDELNGLSYTEVVERGHDISSISNQIYLF